MRLLFIGAPGVGKGSYAQRLSKALDVAHISSGDLLRDAAKSGTTEGAEVKRLIENGEFVKDALIIDLIDAHLARLFPDGHAHPHPRYSRPSSPLKPHHVQHRIPKKVSFILDGFPRNLAQVKAIQGRIVVDHVINFTQPYNVIVAKVSSRRTCGGCGAIYNLASINEGGITMEPLVPKRPDGRCDHCGGTLNGRPDDAPEIVMDRLRRYEEVTRPVEEFYRVQGKLSTFPVLGGVKTYFPLLQTLIERLDTDVTGAVAP